MRSRRRRRAPQPPAAAWCAAAVCGATCADALVVAPAAGRAAAHLNVARAATGDFAWEMRNFENIAYVVDIEVGGQTISAIPDTGSFSLILTSKRCPAEHCRFPRAYDPSASSTYASKGSAHGAIFGSGTVVLEGATDQVSLPGFGPARTLHFWEVIRAGERMAHLWSWAPFQAIMGLSWKTEAPALCKECGDNVVTEPTITGVFGKRTFTACFGKGPSYIYWGASPPAPTSWSRIAVIAKNHWSTLMGGVTMYHTEQRKEEVACFEKPCAALIDTGATDFYVPASMFDKLRHHVGHIAEDCSNLLILPDWRMILLDPAGGRIEVSIPSSEYVIQTTTHIGKRCYLRVYPDESLSGAGHPLWVLGTPFLHRYMVRYDGSTSPASVSLATHPGTCPTPQTAVLSARIPPGGIALGADGAASRGEGGPTADAYSFAKLGGAAV